jgi:integral membrane sensor domain MASE1
MIIQIFGTQQQESQHEESQLLVQKFYDIKNKHRSIRAKLDQSNYFIITLIIALLIALHIHFPLLGIVLDLLHFYILIAFHM